MKGEGSQFELPGEPENHDGAMPTSNSRREFFRTIGAAAAMGIPPAFATNSTIEETAGVTPQNWGTDKEVFENSADAAPLNPEAKARLDEIVHEDYLYLRDQIFKKLAGRSGLDATQDMPALKEKIVDDFAKRASRFVEHQELIKVGDASVKIIGVGHCPETAVAYQHELESAVSNADAIFLEGTPRASRLSTRGDILHFASEHKLSPDEINKLEDAVLENVFRQFFGYTELLAAKHGKPVVTADPDSGGKHSHELMLSFAKSRETPLRNIDDTVLALLLGGSSASVLAGIATAISGQLEKDKIPWAEMESRERGAAQEEIEKEVSRHRHVSRRKFLIGSTLSVLGFGTTLGLTPTINVKGGITSSSPYFDETGTALIYNLIDYRNTVTAEAIKRYAQTHPDKKNILVIYGDAHRIALAKYLQNPKFLATKHALYAPYRSQTTEDLEEFRYRLFDGVDGAKEPGEWEKTYEEKLN